MTTTFLHSNISADLFEDAENIARFGVVALLVLFASIPIIAGIGISDILLPIIGIISVIISVLILSLISGILILNLIIR